MPKPKKPEKEFKWTSDLAYVLGLLVTDGNLSSDGRHISFKSSDYSLVKNLKGVLGLSNSIIPVQENRPNRRQPYLIQFGDVQFYRWLEKIGLSPAKTYTIGAINIPSQYFRDFLRGHLDGDGSILVYEDKYNKYKGKTYKNTRVITRFITASEDHANWLYTKIGQIAPVKGAFIKRPARGRRVAMW